MGNIAGDIFGGGKRQGFNAMQNALEQAEDQEHQALQTGVGFEQPFMGFGRTALGRLLGEVPGDPTQTILSAQKAFTQSPSQTFQQKQALEAIRNAQVAGGTAGSGLQQQQLAQSVSDVTGAQQEQFIRDVLAGRQQDIGALLGTGQIGAGAAGTAARGEFAGGPVLAGLTSQIGQAQAGKDIAGAQELNQLLATIFGTIKGAATGGLGGGFGGALGGGLGAAMGGL